MLFMKKDIERIFSNVIANRIYKGARFDLGGGDYISSEFKSHVNLISESGEKVVIFTRTGFPTAFYSPDSGEFVICERKGKEDKVLYRFYRYKQIYTNSLEEFEAMESKGKERDYRRYAETQTTILKPDHVLPIVRRHTGYKRTKASDICSVDKLLSSNGTWYFSILVRKNDRFNTITVSGMKRR